MSFAILAAVAIVLQTALGPHLADSLWASPDWLFLLLVYLALHAPAADAMLAGWILGLLWDLGGNERIGLGAMVFGLCAAGIVQVRELLLTHRPLTTVSVTWCFGLGVWAALGLYQLWFHFDWPYVKADLLAVLYTAALAPYLHGGLRRMDSLLGLRASRGSGRRRR